MDQRTHFLGLETKLNSEPAQTSSAGNNPRLENISYAQAAAGTVHNTGTRRLVDVMTQNRNN